MSVKGVRESVALLGKRSNFELKYGPGGRSSNSGITATVFGGYGFVGKYFINELGVCGSRVYVPFRGCELEVRHLRPSFDLGQIGFIPFSGRDEDTIWESVQHSDIVVNMIGKHFETKHAVPTRRSDGTLSRVNYNFEEVHVDIPKRIAAVSKAAGVKAFVHLSSLSACASSVSQWSQSKAKGEAAVREAFPESIIVKAAPIFGAEDRFLNWIAEANSKLPFFPLVNGGSALVQPVYANDIGKALMAIVQGHEHFLGKTFQLAGPAEYSYKEIIEFVSDVTGVRKPLVDVPMSLAMLGGRLCEESINPFLTRDLLQQMQEDAVLKTDDNTNELLTFKDIDMQPSSMDKVAFDFLHRFRPGGHFTIVKGYH